MIPHRRVRHPRTPEDQALGPEILREEGLGARSAVDDVSDPRVGKALELSADGKASDRDSLALDPRVAAGMPFGSVEPPGDPAGPLAGTLELAQSPSQRPNTTTALWPPKPKPLDIATRTWASRATPAT